MKMSNVHERTIAAPAARVGVLLDTLSSADDKFWPHENWPGVKFNLPLQVGATGGHGTGPYTVSSYTPGRHLRFEFSGGRQGYHEFTLQEVDDMTCLLRHALKAELTFNSAWRWYFLTRPLHNALIEDLFDNVESQVARVEHPQIWSSRVQKLRQKRGMSPVKDECHRGASVSSSRSDHELRNRISASRLESFVSAAAGALKSLAQLRKP